MSTSSSLSKADFPLLLLATVLSITVLGACFTGDFTRGLPCTDDSDCGPGLVCEDELCGGPGFQQVCGNLLVETGESCDDGNEDNNDGCTSTCLLSAPTLTFHQVKTFNFQWSEVRGAEWYELYERVDEEGLFVRVGGRIEGLSVQLTVPLHLRANASYKYLACRSKQGTDSCIESAEVGVSPNMLDAIGHFTGWNSYYGSSLGFSIKLSGDGNTLAMGAPGEDNGTGVVYISTRESDGSWVQQGYIYASDGDAGDEFGYSLSLSSDGDTLAVGAPSPHVAVGGGAFYIFTREGDTWALQDSVKAPTISVFNFGTKVALSGTGNTLAVTTDDLGASKVFVYIRVDDMWVKQEELESSEPNDRFGRSVALSGDGNTLAVGTPGEGGTGAILIYKRIQSEWTALPKLVKSSAPGLEDDFGASVTLSDDGNTLAVGAPFEDSRAKGLNGDKLDNLNTDSGAVYLFTQAGDMWTEEVYVKASNPKAGHSFGLDLALSQDGKILAASTPWESSYAKGLHGDGFDNTLYKAGATYLFTKSNGEWTQSAYIKSPHTAGGDGFGTSVSLSADGETLAIGSPGTNNVILGMKDGVIFDAGAVFLY